MNIPSADTAREILAPLSNQTDSLVHQQTLIASALQLLREKKEESISCYMKEVNKPLSKIGMSIIFETIPSFDDGTPFGILSKAYFYLIDDGFVIFNRECPNFFHPEIKFQNLIAFISEATKFIEDKELAHLLESSLPTKTITSQGKI